MRATRRAAVIPQSGDSVTLDGVEVYDYPNGDNLWVTDDVLCVDLQAYPPRGSSWTREAAAFAGGWLYEWVEPGTGPSLDRWAEDECWPLWQYADALLDDLDARAGVRGYRVIEAKAHRDVQMPWHRDRTAPPGTVLNVITFFSRGCTGGELVLPEHGIAFAPRHLRVVVFDGQTLHGVAPFTLDDGGYRLSLVMYLGEA